MGWESRKRGGQYYTRYSREGDRVMREYVPLGVAEQYASEDEERRRKKLKWRQEERIELARLREIDARVEDYYQQVTAALEADLAQAGYRRHKGGEWRKAGQIGRPRKDKGKIAKEMEIAPAPAENDAPTTPTDDAI